MTEYSCLETTPLLLSIAIIYETISKVDSEDQRHEDVDIL